MSLLVVESPRLRSALLDSLFASLCIDSSTIVAYTPLIPLPQSSLCCSFFYSICAFKRVLPPPLKDHKRCIYKNRS